MRELVDRTMGERIEVVVEADGAGCTVEVDRSQLQSAILNVASNARDAMADGGRLTVSTRDTTGADGAHMIAIEISDTGTGMDNETLGRIFEPFFTTKPTGKGTGLGLSQVYGFASQSGGTVRVSSEPGTGTMVSLVLPCCDEQPSDRAAPGGEVGAQATASVLVVEDNEDVGAFAETLLEELGHDVTLVKSGEEALELARSRDFDLVFSDVVMPGMGGLKLAEMLRAEKPGLPVILATGYSQEIAQGGSGDWPVILKPYRLATLSEAVADALNGNAER
jgi:CheY-like chemotaxis protein/anti-sigma regulatory factor (Ser/Thr protein kinase)